ncbi:MAG: hypothetical protein QGH70_11825, partial [Nitrospinota bacterium]|nr:hypothetical protein [Nitrospinota bacterium]
MRVNIGSRFAAAALGLGLLPGACSPPPLPSSSGFLEAYLNHPGRTLKDTVHLLERKSGGERRKALETILRGLGVRYEVQRYQAAPDATGSDEGANLFFDLGGGNEPNLGFADANKGGAWTMTIPAAGALSGVASNVDLLTES